jgi:uncharacterized protein (DUF433 family)
METMEFTPAQASAVANLPLRTVQKLIDRRLIRPRLRRTGRSFQRMLTREQLLYLRLEAKGVRLLPMATRRSIAKEIEKSPEIDAVCLTEGSVLVVQVKLARQELDQDLERLQRAEEMIVSDPDIMRGSPVYRGTRIPVQLVADMLSQGATPDEIVEGYPSLDKEKVTLAPLYVQAFPRRGRPMSRPWAKGKPILATRHRRRSPAERH